MDAVPHVEHRCPHCFAQLYALGARECWMCGGPLTPKEGVVEQVVLRASTGRRRGLHLVCVLVFVLVFLGLVILAPLLGILLAILVVSGLLRVVAVAARRRKEGRPMTRREEMATFLCALAVILAVGTAMVGAWVATMLAIRSGGNGRQDPFEGFLCGGLAALLVFFGALIAISEQRD